MWINPEARELGGVGLGLALVYEIVRVHDGNIVIRDNPSGGTVFEVIFDDGIIFAINDCMVLDA